MTSKLGSNVCEKVWCGVWNKEMNELSHKEWEALSNEFLEKVRSELRYSIIEHVYIITGRTV